MTPPIQSHILSEGDVRITVLSVGCAVQDWQVAGRRVVLGYPDPEIYRANPKSMGIVAGRVVNRISDAAFTLDGQVWRLPANEGGTHIHGGPGGLGWSHWEMDPEGDRAVVLRRHSPHLEMGYPGAVDFTVRMALEDGALTWEMTAVPDRETPVNMAQHLYFNLSGGETVRDHAFRIAASAVTPNDEKLIPTGERLPVDGTRFDFRQVRTLEAADPAGEGYDLNYALDPGAGPQMTAEAPDGMRLELWTDRPGLQFYSSNWLDEAAPPWPGQSHGRFGGFCVEAQDFPNALNTPGFGSILCRPEAPYRQRTTIRIAPGA
ncbi:aldose epimerase family protein [Pseudoponticoccus marisrubri]|uniref:Aldose 1-epimerase n=1 Tax=Pseudoponticoccus marisrubri TaxID=1685382 RepID=A0A0W7WJ71_9RHOB|nr:aldose epimerase family protein [Pseudoponticoccus marisrubri]KUF10564.1 hypothetical protein AVJ23_11845 [Pseudoponticoccus marisrubri]